ncbi:MAG: hypothetical protein K1X67_04270 [Fimbriimonadaceae bacterium]|nr:hypothetical protein [Fimbriimonadaceae bacterium]
MSHGSAAPCALRRALLLLVCAGVASGCGKKAPPPYPTWYEPPKEYAAQAKSANAYDGYVLAAQQAESAGKEDINRVSFTFGQRKRLAARLQGATKTLMAAASKPCTIPDRSFRPDQAPTYQRGWRLLGRSLAWKVEDALNEQKPDEAIRIAAIGTKFGFDLTAGNVGDAALGYQIVDECRAALAPALPTLSPVDLTRLIEAFQKVLTDKPPIASMLENERRQMLAAVQFVQDSYRKDDYSELKQQLGPDAREPIRYLEEMKDKDGPKRVEYFQNFADEIDPEIALLRKRASQPAEARGPIPLPASDGRPWKRLSRHFFRSARPVIDLSDRALARVRLLILNAIVLRSIRESGKAVLSFAALPKSLTTDPYSGRPFRFSAVGAEYKLYSIGSDLRDDGGETDELGLGPDLVLGGFE